MRKFTGMQEKLGRHQEILSRHRLGRRSVVTKKDGFVAETKINCTREMVGVLAPRAGMSFLFTECVSGTWDQGVGAQGSWAGPFDVGGESITPRIGPRARKQT